MVTNANIRSTSLAVKWEYTIFVKTLSDEEMGRYNQIFTDILNDYGSQGWRYVEHEQEPGPGYMEQLTVIFEREVWPEIEDLEDEAIDDSTNTDTAGSECEVSRTTVDD